ncbi:hypothetical protein BH11MYX2_BH11MYX2_40680 [soil metagenome]
MARLLLIRRLVVVETIFQYRTLMGKCELGCGLDWDEIQAVCDIEHELVRDDGKSGRRYKRVPVALEGILRGDRINDRVAIVELGPGGLICRGAPFVAQGELVELVLNVGDHSYRFRAIGKWLKDDGDDYKVGLQFVGVPLCLNIAQVSAHEFDLIDQINAAA